MEEPEGRHAWGKTWGEGRGATLPAPPQVHQLESSLNPVLSGGFIEVLLHRHD